MATEDGRVVIISGGNSGIGRAISRAFAADSQLMILGRNKNTLRETAEALGAVWYQADVSRLDQVKAVVDDIAKEYGKIDVLVNNAGLVRGISTDMPIEEAERNWDEEIDVNLKGSFLMTMACVPYLTRPGGRIISISSIAAFTGGSRPGAMGYAAAKAGIHGLTYGLARELSSQGITANVVAPGFIAGTAFTGYWPDERVREIVSQTPVGRPGDVTDVAAAVRFLASPEASFITGEVLNVNGGWSFGH